MSEAAIITAAHGPEDQRHQYFSASQTRHASAFDRSDALAWAVHYQSPPVDQGDGRTSIKLNLPMLIVTAYAAEAQALAERAARILNKHWDDEA